MPDQKSFSEFLHVKIVSAEFVEEFQEVKSLTTQNEAGLFDVLAGHIRFVSIITKSVDVVLNDGTKKHFDFDQGVIKVKDNEVIVFLEKF